MDRYEYYDVLAATTFLETLMKAKKTIIEILQQGHNKKIMDDLGTLNKVVQEALLAAVKNIKLEIKKGEK